MEEKKKAVGRPAKLSPEMKMEIVNSYFVYVADYCPEKMAAHGVYSDIIRYAKTLEWVPGAKNLRVRNLTDDPEVRTYINTLANQSTHKYDKDSVDPYIPVEFDVLERWSKQDIIRFFRNRELRNEERYVFLHQTVARCEELQRENNRLVQAMFKMEADLHKSRTCIGEQKGKLLDLAEELKQIKRSAKSTSDALTKKHFESIPKRGYSNNVISLMGTQTVGPQNVDDDSSSDDEDEIMEWTYGKN